MISLAMCLIYLQEKGYEVSLTYREWSLISIGALIIFYSFIQDYTNIIIEGDFLENFWTLRTNEKFNQIISEFRPTCYNWIMFSAGEILILSSVVLVLLNVKSQKQSKTIEQIPEK